MARNRGFILLTDLLLLLIHYASTAAAAATCYSPRGEAVDDSVAQPCNASAAGVAGSHTACCSGAHGDACLSTGLCFASWGPYPYETFWGGGCTDPTGKDPSCFGSCRTDVSSFDGYFMVPCSLYTWCCCGYSNETVCDIESCCANSFTLPDGPGFVTHILTPASGSGIDGGAGQSPAIQIPAFSSSPSFAAAADDNNSTGNSSTCAAAAAAQTTTVAAVGGVLGTLLLAALVAAAWLGWRVRALRRDVISLRAGTAPELDLYPRSGTARPSVNTSANTSAHKGELPGTEPPTPDDAYQTPVVYGGMFVAEAEAQRRPAELPTGDDWKI